MTLRAGLVGAGSIGKFHVHALRRLKGVEIVGVTDLHADRAARFGEEMGVGVYPSLQALREAGANVIHIVTPPASHVSIALEAMALGCDLYIEKPMATSVEDCTRIEEAARASNRTVCVGHSLLYDPFVRRTLELVQQGAIGDVLTFDYHRCMNQQSYAAAGVSADQLRGGYPFRDIGIHALYLAEAFIGPIRTVESWPMATGRGDCTLWLDEWRVLARGERTAAQIQLSWNVRPQQNVFTVQGTRGIIRADLFGLSVTQRKQRPLPEPATRILNALGEGRAIATQAIANVTRVARKKLWQFHGVQALIAEFYERLAAGKAAPVTPADATRAVYWTEHVAREADALVEQWAASITAARSGAMTLVTGGGGFIGSHLVRRLLENGIPVRLLLRRPAPADIAANPLVEIVLGDLSDAAVVDRAVAGVETVYHVGATMRGGAMDFDRGTMAGTRHIVESCVRHGVGRLVYMSSLAVIDTDEGRTGEPITESSRLEQRPEERGHYTRTKLDAEQLVLDAVRDRGLRAVLLRPGEVVSPEKPLLTPGVAQRAGKNLIVIGDGRVRLPLVHIGDVVDALIGAADGQIPSGTIIQLVEDAGLTQNDIIAHYVGTTGGQHRVIHLPLPLVLTLARVMEVVTTRLLGRALIGPRRIRAATASRRFDMTRAETLLGWKARHGVKSILVPQPGPVPPAASR